MVYQAKHQLTHRTIQARIYKITFKPEAKFKKSDIFEVTREELLHRYALPRLLDRYCKAHLF